MNWSIEEFNLGSITAFGDAKIGGFSGTKEQFYSLIKKVARGAYLIDIDKSTTTLDSGNWSNNQYDLTSVYPTNKYKIFSVTLDYDNATSSQIDAWNNGDITLCDGNILKALGNVPLVDLPIVVVFQGLIIAVEVPVLSGSLVFDGTEQTPTFTGYDPNTMIMGGDTAETNAGDYTAAFTPRTGYMWSDGTTGVKFVPWSIAKAVVTAPTVTANLTYDGTEQTATVSEYDSDLVSVTGITGTNAGTYTATVSLIDSVNTEWTNGSTDDITYEWVIAKISVTAPTVSSSLVYDGTEQTATVSAYDPNLVRVTGTTGTNAGDYTAIVALLEKNNHEWSNGTTADIQIVWTIAKAQGYITLSSYTVTIDDNHPSATVTILTHSGSVSVSSSDTSIATATLVDNTIEISGVNHTEGSVTVTVLSSVTENYSSYEQGITVSCYVVVPVIYGAEWNYVPSSKWTRTDDSADFPDPQPYYNGIESTPYSPFDEIEPWASMTKSERTGGTMVAIPKFYYKMENTISNRYGLRIKIAPKSNGAAWAVNNGFSVSPAHMDRGDGYGERDVIYVGRYHCGSDYKSKTEVLPKIQVTRGNYRNSIHQLGSTLWQWDYATLITIWMLYLVEFADWDSQSKIGGGCGTPSVSYQVFNMGYTDSMPYHTGTTASSISANVYGGTQYRNIEGLWDNCWDWVDGVNFNSSDVYVSKNPSTYTDNSTSGTRIGMRFLGNSMIKNFKVATVSGFEWVLYPDQGGANKSEYTCDGYVMDSYYRQLLCHGANGQGSEYGMFCINSSFGKDRYGTVSSRIMELPNNT